MQQTKATHNGYPPLPGAGGVTTSIPLSTDYWDDPDYQDGLVAWLVNDQTALEQLAEHLSADDFKPSTGVSDGHARWTAASRALDYFEKYGKPIGNQLRADVLAYAKQINMGSMRVNELLDYMKRLPTIDHRSPLDYVVQKALEFKSGIAKKSALNEMADLLASGQLPDETWAEISQRVLAISGRKTAEVPDVPQWPEPLNPEALHGLAGEVVRAIGPNTESDPAALLVQFLLAFGNVIGRHPHWKIEATPHHMNLFAALVGATSKARKGTSLNRVLDLFEDVDRDWLAMRRMSGLSTGEGLIKQICDPQLNKNGEEVGGVADKRLLIVEPEFARVLKVGERDAATLPSILRDAWDRGDLQTLTKESPLRATGAHISLITHITEEELRRALSDTNRSNGFANRFLWVCVRRSKTLPRGGAALTGAIRNTLVSRLREAVKEANRVQNMGFSKPAAVLWDKGYRGLSEGEPGALGAVTDRAEAQVRRLACLYALLDRERFVKEPHLRAALEVWRYCFDSARFIFGTSMGDPVADTILKELRRRGATGISRNDIRKDLFQQNKSSEAIGHALQSLQKRGVARNRPIAGVGAGRPTEQWYAV